MSNKRETYKVSASLINSYLNMRIGKYKDSSEQFINTLSRIPLQDSYVLKRGNAFEDAVTKYKSEPFYETVTKCDKQVISIYASQSSFPFFLSDILALIMEKM